MNIEYCPTGEMTSDYYTKALTRSQFWKMQNLIVRIKENTIAAYNKDYKQYIKDELQWAAATWSTTKDHAINSGIIGHDMKKLLGYDESRSVLGKQEECASKKSAHNT